MPRVTKTRIRTCGAFLMKIKTKPTQPRRNAPNRPSGPGWRPLAIVGSTWPPASSGSSSQTPDKPGTSITASKCVPVVKAEFCRFDGVLALSAGQRTTVASLDCPGRSPQPTATDRLCDDIRTSTRKRQKNASSRDARRVTSRTNSSSRSTRSNTSYDLNERVWCAISTTRSAALRLAPKRS